MITKNAQHKKENINLHLQDTQWPFEYIDHDRTVARAIVYDEIDNFILYR